MNAGPNQTLQQMTHPELVKALAKPGRVIADEMCAHDADLIHMVLGVAGESGELVDAVKKAVIYRKPLNRENMIEEMGDMEFYLEGLRQHLDVTREQVLLHNTNKLAMRYHQGSYSNLQAQQRADKEANA